ncbi:hypothetical protein B7494_g7943 [Chlorociboria aeruginascens]|nr:hypothetical protein B7494_g7943 [Chlorociboria aeruginascens]
MSSLKDIMDVDVEPLESQAYRRSREAAQQQTLRSFNDLIPSSEPPLSLLDDDKGETSIPRRRSNRVSKPASSHPISPNPGTARRQSSTASEAMEFSSAFQPGGPNQLNTSGSPPQSSRGLEPALEVPVKYTPVTGRISKARKGVPVHTCDLCRPVKTFTRAEHLRRHQLSHQKPAYPCTFQDCERAFHRPDLLARHLHRHETQGEKAYRSGDPRSRASSSTSDNFTPALKVEPPSQGDSGATASQTSPTDSITPRTSASGESSMTASSFNITTSNFQPVNFSSPGPSNQQSASRAQLPETDSCPSMSPGASSSRPPVDYDQMTSNFSIGTATDIADHAHFTGPSQDGFQDMYVGGGNSQYANYYTTSHVLPLLRIPEDSYMPGLSYTQDNSPWCSSASDSTYSTQSDGSRNGRHWSHRARSASIATVPDWVAPAPWSPHGISSTPQDLRSPPFDSIMEQYETQPSPRMTSPNASRQLLDVPNTFGGYYMESVGTPALSTYNKPLSQMSSALPSPVSDTRLAGIDRRPKSLLDSQQLGTLTIGTSLTPPCQAQHVQLGDYLSSYWQFFDPLFPIIHRPTFDPNEDSLLSCAMAAIGTQYHDTIEARQRGMELNESCRKSIDHYPNWTVKIMQAILLTEIFTTFRGKTIVIRLSRPFEEVFNRLLANANQSEEQFSSHSPATLNAASALLDRFGSQGNHPVVPNSDLHSRWTYWVGAEARRRLLGLCFMFDVRQAIYHEQSRSKSQVNITANGLLCEPCPETLWNASTATEWQTQRSGYTIKPLLRMERDIISLYDLSPRSAFTRSLIICVLATQLPVRLDANYVHEFSPRATHPAITNLVTFFPVSFLAHAYLALHHTPLHDLLAVAGDTWVFGKKIPTPAAFHSAQSRLKSWSSSLAAAAATQHACHILQLTLSNPHSTCIPAEGQIDEYFRISDYWSLFVAALICWAFGHRHQNGHNGTLSRTNSSAALGAMDPEESPLRTHASAEDLRLKGLNYANAMLELDVEELLTSKAHMRGDSLGVVDAVKARLDVESIGGKCSMLVDAVGILNRIQRGGRGKWF